MRRIIVVVTLTMLAATPAADAGTLADGKWAATGCGTRPAEPAIDPGGVDAYNRSLKEVREWQQKAQAYNNCVVKEANTDNDTIAKEANAEQERYRTAVAEIGAAAGAVKSKLDRK